MLTLNQSKVRLYIWNIFHSSVDLSCFGSLSLMPSDKHGCRWSLHVPYRAGVPRSVSRFITPALPHIQPELNKQTNTWSSFAPGSPLGAPAFKEVPNLWAICQNNVFCLSGPNSACLFKTGMLTDGSLGSWWTLSDGFCQINGAERRFCLDGRQTVFWLQSLLVGMDRLSSA